MDYVCTTWSVIMLRYCLITDVRITYTVLYIIVYYTFFGMGVCLAPGVNSAYSVHGGGQMLCVQAVLKQVCEGYCVCDSVCVGKFIWVKLPRSSML
jgi:hypothetical protein